MNILGAMLVVGLLGVAMLLTTCGGLPGGDWVDRAIYGATALFICGEAAAYLLHRRWVRRRLAEMGYAMRSFRPHSGFVSWSGPVRLRDWYGSYQLVVRGPEGERRASLHVRGPCFGLRPGARFLDVAGDAPGSRPDRWDEEAEATLRG